MSRPTKISNSTKRKIRAQLTYERNYRDTHSRHLKEHSVPVYTMVREEKEEHWGEALLGGIAIVLAPVLYGLATLIFGV